MAVSVYKCNCVGPPLVYYHIISVSLEAFSLPNAPTLECVGDKESNKTIFILGKRRQQWSFWSSNRLWAPLKKG